jgi:twitching motility protein PilT
MAPLRQRDVQDFLEQITSQEQRVAFDRERELDFAYSVPQRARFRVNIMKQRGSLAIAFRMVPFTIPTIDEMKLPQIFKQLVLKPRGVVLVTGPTGSGKSIRWRL